MEQITVNLLATGETPVCHVSQFDEDRTIRFNLKKGTEAYTLSGTETVKMRIRKPDNTERVIDITNTSSSYVDYVSVPEDCDIAGVNVCELVIDDLGSKNFNMKVEEDAYGGGADIETLTASGPIATFETNIVDNLVDLKAEITPIQDLHGYDYPWPAGGGKNILLKPFVHYSLAPDNLADMFFIKAGDYRFSFSDSTAENWRVGLRMKDAEGNNLSDIAYKPNSGMSWRSEGNYWLGGTNSTNKSILITIAEDCYIRVIFGYASTTVDTEFTNVQLEKGTTQTSYEPVENICPISGHDSARLFRTGKNLLSPTLYKGLSYNPTVGTTVTLTESPKQLTDNHDGTFSISTTANWETFCMIVPIKSITYYRKTVISSNGALGTTEVWLDKNLKVIRTYNSTDTSQTKNGLLTIPDNASYFAWVITNRAVANSTLTITQPQIELGSEVTDYEPYAGSEVTVQFGQTVYKGVLDAKNSKVVATYALVDLSSLTKSGWSYSAQFNCFYHYLTPSSGVENQAKDRFNALCSDYRFVGGYTSLVENSCAFIYNTAIAIRDSRYADLEAFRDGISGELVYELATPIEIPLSAISQFETLLGINNVYSDIGDVELKYLKQV